MKIETEKKVVYAKVVFAGLCNFGFIVSWNWKKVVYAGVCNFVSILNWNRKNVVYAKVVYAGLCDFGFYCNLKPKKSGLCRFMQVYAGLCILVTPKKICEMTMA